MRKSTFFVILAIAVMGVGCNREGGASKDAVLVAPSDKHDGNAWGQVIRQGLASDAPKVSSRPYTFFVPSDGDADAESKRKNESEAIATLIEQSTVPGRTIGIGGPDPDKTAEVIIQALKGVTAGRATGLTIVVVGGGHRDEELRKQAEASGADIRIKSVTVS